MLMKFFGRVGCVRCWWWSATWCRCEKFFKEFYHCRTGCADFAMDEFFEGCSRSQSVSRICNGIVTNAGQWQL